MRKQRWFARGLWLAILAMMGAALPVANQAQPLAEPAVPSFPPQNAQENRLPVRPSDSVSQPRTGIVPAAAVSAITVSIGGGTVTATTSDPDVELTASKGGKLLRIADAKTGQQFTINAQEFSIQQGDGANSLRAAGDTLTFYRGTAPLVVISRTRRVASAVPSVSPAVPGYLNQPPTPPRHLVSGAVSPDGRHVVTAHFDRTIRIWNAAAGNELRTLDPYRDRILGVMFAAEGREIAIVSQDGIRLIDVASGNPLRTIGSSLRKIDLAAISADGRHLLTATKGAAHTFDVAAGHIKGALMHRMDFVNSVGISADGSRGLCVGGYHDNSDTPRGEVARVWDLASRRVLFDLKPSQRSAVHGALSPDGKLVAAPDLDQDKRLALWDVDTGQQVRLFETHRWPQRLYFSPDGKRLASQVIDGSIEVLDVGTGEKIAFFSEPPLGAKLLGWRPDNNLLVGSDGNSIRHWRVSDRNPSAAANRPVPTDTARTAESVAAPASTPELRRIELEERAKSVAFTPDGKYALIAGRDTNLRLWDLQTGKEAKRFTGDQVHHFLRHVAVSPDGQRALLAGGMSIGSHRLSLWDVDKWREVRHFKELDNHAASVAFSADGRLVAAGSVEGDVRVWEAESGEQVAHYQPGVREARCVDIGPDGKLAVYAGGHADFRLRLWDVKTSKEVRVLEGHTRPAIRAMFLPDGQQIVSAGDDQTIRLWDVESGKEVRRMQERSLIRCLAVAADGRRAISGALDGTVSVWDLQTGRQLARYAQHTGRVEAVAAIADGQHVYSASDDRTIRIWPLPSIETASATRAAEPSERAPADSAAPGAPASDPAGRAASALEQSGLQLHRGPSRQVMSASAKDRLQQDDWNGLAKLPELRALHLQMPLSDDDLAQLQRLPALETLFIVSSDLSDAGLQAIGKLKGLQHLTLFETRITGEGLAALKALPQLRGLSIYGSQITDDGLVHLQSLAKLQRLMLNDSAVSGKGAVHLQQLPELYHVALNESPITDEGLEQIAKLPRLMTLELRMCPQITDDGLRHLSTLTRLRTLQLDGTAITNAGLAHLQGLLGLQGLGIGRTKVTEAGLQQLDPLVNLRTLWLNELKISESGVARLRDKLPHLKRIDGLPRPQVKSQ